jgi:hypothetical protein
MSKRCIDWQERLRSDLIKRLSSGEDPDQILRDYIDGYYFDTEVPMNIGRTKGSEMKSSPHL